MNGDSGVGDSGDVHAQTNLESFVSLCILSLNNVLPKFSLKLLYPHSTGRLFPRSSTLQIPNS